MMKTKNIIWAALSMAAALVMTACSSEENMVEPPAAPQAEVKTIPYSVTVNGGSSTRATVDDDNKTLYFAAGDKLYITGMNVKGVLDITGGTGTTSATFSGDLTVSGGGTVDPNLSLTATLVSAQQTVGTEVSVSESGAVTVNYPTTAYCTDVATAVQQYSWLTGSSTYGAKSFTLSQQTAFLNFVISFNDGTIAGTELSTVVRNNGAALCTANVTTVSDGGVKAKFVLPVATSTTLSGATVMMATKPALSINNATLSGKVYNITRTILSEGALTGKFTINSSGDMVCFSKGNLQASTNNEGESWTWKFAENQWDYIGEATANTSLRINGTVYADGTADLFGWVGASSNWTGANQYGLSSAGNEGGADYGNVYGEPLKSDWGTLPISNGGNVANSGWRTLTIEEWTYLLHTRASGSTVFGTTNARYVHATINIDVNAVSGIILFPDGVRIRNAEVSETGDVVNGNTTQPTKCTAAEWSALEAKGCVFLPPAGYRYMQGVSWAGEGGFYWSCSSRDGDVYYMNLSGGSLECGSWAPRNWGMSVRLVRPTDAAGGETAGVQDYLWNNMPEK